MRQLLIDIPEQSWPQLARTLNEQNALNVTRLPTMDAHKNLIIAHVENRAVNALLEIIEEIENSAVTLLPYDALPLSPPADEMAESVIDVAPRSTLEVWLNGWQSFGSWGSFLWYAITASVVVWIGLHTNTSYLLVAAMLIAPFAGPAMLVAMGSAAGHWEMVRRNLVRYAVVLGVTVGTTFLLSILFGQERATDTMISVSRISTFAVLLPLAGGTAGALDLVQSEKSSLVAGTAVGMLVAASLAPPSGMIGMALAIGRFDLAANGLFVLLMQLLALNLAGALTFRVAGLTSDGIRFERGQPRIYHVSLGASALLLAGMLLFQWSSPLTLQRSTLEQRVEGTVETLFENDPLITFIEGTFSFPRPQADGQKLLATLYITTDLSDEAATRHVIARTHARVTEEFESVEPLVSVVIVEEP